VSTFHLTVYDGHPNESGDCAWGDPWRGREVRGRAPDSVMRRYWPLIRRAARRSGEYARGDTLWAIVHADGRAHQYSTTI